MTRLAVVLTAAAAAFALAGCSGSDGGDSSATPAVATVTVTGDSGARTTTGTAPSRGSGAFSDIPDIVENVSPSVVAILVRSSQGSGEGSGVIWSADGKIVTNNHVVDGADELEVVFASGTRAAAKVLATDRFTDLAVITVEKNGLPAAKFASSLPEVGSLAIAIGSPLGFQNSVTAGIISGLHRSLPGGQSGGPAISELMQTDAAISPGNSGGGLVNGDGVVIGINDAYIPPNAGAVSIGFAIPAITVVPTVKQLIENGKAEHAFLGIQPAELTPALAERFGITVDTGVLVYQLVPNSAAADAGIEAGDVITALDGREIRSVEDLLSFLAGKKPGDKIAVGLVRGSEKKTVEVTLADRPG